MVKPLQLRIAAIAVFLFALIASAPALAERPTEGKRQHEKTQTEGHTGDHGDRKHGKHEKHAREDGKGKKHQYEGHKQDRKEHDEQARDRYRDDDDDRHGDRDENDGGRHRHFTDENRQAIRDYYAKQFNRGKCPPGLEKKNNGCMPPGLAKEWSLGHELPREVVYYEVPPTVLINLGPPPAGHRFVRVAGDILLIATGTRMVLDAMADLSSMK